MKDETRRWLTEFGYPMTGLFGTAISMIRAFSRMSVPARIDFSLLLSDVAVAVLATACGMIVLTIAMCVYDLRRK